jgi:DNA-binding NarL/FixJ family response regulator
MLAAMVLRCLIVDDNPQFLEAARELLDREGIAVVGVASTGAEALERSNELRPEVTLVDIDLGEESGFDVAQRLTNATDGRSHVILISTYAETDFADLVEASPAVGFLSKSDLSAGAISGILESAKGEGRSDASETRGT